MTEPRITVTAKDRQAVCDAHGVPHADYNWVATGERGLVSWNRQAYAIARARTMAAFEERVSCVRRWLSSIPTELLGMQLSDAELSLAEIADVNCDLAGEFLRERKAPPTDDDIRALVLAGWDRTT